MLKGRKELLREFGIEETLRTEENPVRLHIATVIDVHSGDRVKLSLQGRVIEQAISYGTVTINDVVVVLYSGHHAVVLGQATGGTGVGFGFTVLSAVPDYATLLTLSATASDGDAHYDAGNGDFYVWSSSTSSWHDLGHIQGPAGSIGAMGPPGPQGIPGPQGLQGIQGPRGVTGVRGSIWSHSAVVPPLATNAPPGGWRDGDQLLHEGDSELFLFKGGVWVDEGVSIKGDQGPMGPPGPRGTIGNDGIRGSIWSHSAVVPPLATNAPPGGWRDGDQLLHEGDSELFLFKGGVWVDEGVSIKGDQGPMGPPGPRGTIGNDGIRGSLWFHGDYMPFVTPPTPPPGGFLKGDQYMVATDTFSDGGEVYIYTGTGWHDEGYSILGPEGPMGPHGTAVTVLGTVQSFNDLPHPFSLTAANDGEVHFVTDTGDLWIYEHLPGDSVLGAWHNMGHVQGPQGVAGATGGPGPPGIQGVRGSLWRHGTGVPSSTISGAPTGGWMVGDQYFDDATGELYVVTALNVSGYPTWTDEGVSIKGTQGPQGVPGPRGVHGIQGVRGSLWRHGTGVPGSGGAPTGGWMVGDQYFDDATGELYVVTAMVSGNPTWTDEGVSIMGPQGPQGVPGPRGVHGVAGANGAVGAPGVQGIQGAKGATGTRGPAGIRGPAGAKGTTGSRGPAGPKGNTGATGTRGPAGSVSDAHGDQRYYTSGNGQASPWIVVSGRAPHAGEANVGSGCVWLQV